MLLFKMICARELGASNSNKSPTAVSIRERSFFFSSVVCGQVKLTVASGESYSYSNTDTSG